jgi:lysine 2,3-aminomutase
MRQSCLATSICPVYCRFCTRSYVVGASTDAVQKRPQRPSRLRWERVFEHIKNDASLEDVVISGGDAYQLTPDSLQHIGQRYCVLNISMRPCLTAISLLQIPHIRIIRFASKGLRVTPGRIIDKDKSETWADALIDLPIIGRRSRKKVCLHTHINHLNEVTWITELAAAKLFKHGINVRNQIGNDRRRPTCA